MTTAEALNLIPEIVAKAIPMNAYKEISCAVKRKAMLDNAEWRREQLAIRIRSLIIQHEGNGGLSVSIEMGELKN